MSTVSSVLNSTPQNLIVQLDEYSLKGEIILVATLVKKQ